MSARRLIGSSPFFEEDNETESEEPKPLFAGLIPIDMLRAKMTDRRSKTKHYQRSTVIRFYLSIYRFVITYYSIFVRQNK